MPQQSPIYRIWKFPLKYEHSQYISIPRENKPIAIQLQDNVPTIWMLVDPNSPRVSVKIRMFATGESISNIVDTPLHLGTIQADYGFVWHFFSEIPGA